MPINSDDIVSVPIPTSLSILLRTPVGIPYNELRSTPSGRAEMVRRGYRDKKLRGHALQPFVAWDGEGIEYNGEHRYALFGCSNGQFVQGVDLSTRQLLNTLLRGGYYAPNSIHVGFAIGYDSEMILRDFNSEELRILYQHNRIRWQGYYIEYIRGKYFHVIGHYRNTKISIRVWDIFSFFQCSFVKAVRSYLGEIPELAQIEEGKADRGSFVYEQLDEYVRPYWEQELKVTVALADKLRSLLHQVDIKLTRWHGPGALVSYMFRQKKIKQHMSQKIPKTVMDWAQFRIRWGTDGAL